jgi:hypothetical protein
MHDDDYTYAFTPRKMDGPRAVGAETRHDLEGMEGEIVSAEQCDGCGNHTYRIYRNGQSFYAKCEADPDEDPEFAHPDPCGATYTISLHRAGGVIF